VLAARAASVAATRPRERVVIGDTSQPLAYAFFHHASSRSTLPDAGARDGASAQSLLKAIERTATNGPLALVNEPARGPLHDALSAHGAWTKTARQYRLIAKVEDLVPY
jgi:hypothetical protein